MITGTQSQSSSPALRSGTHLLENALFFNLYFYIVYIIYLPVMIGILFWLFSAVQNFLLYNIHDAILLMLFYANVLFKLITKRLKCY